jgi:inorganic pyrophosphatase
MYDFPIKTKSFPHVLPAYIEISKGNNIKYEWCEESKILMLDRVLHSSVIYPENYGFIPQTLCEDGDPLDVLILSNHKFQPGTIVHVRPICYMNMTDEKGRDEKLLAVPLKEPYFKDVKTMGDLSEHKLTEIREFFKTYKNLEKDKWTMIEEWNDTEMSIKLIERTHSAYMNKI